VLRVPLCRDAPQGAGLYGVHCTDNGTRDPQKDRSVAGMPQGVAFLTCYKLGMYGKVFPTGTV